MTTGLDLKVMRIRAGATQADIGQLMGVSASRISVIERSGNTAGTRLDFDTANRYREAVKQYGRNSVPVVIEIVAGLGDVPNQYSAAKAQARADVRSNPGQPFIVKIEATTPAATALGYLDGLDAAGVSPTVLDGGGTIVNRRVG